MMDTGPLPVAVIGAGPIGLAAAHLSERGIAFVVFDVGDDVAASIREWAHVQLFSPWSYNIDPAAPPAARSHRLDRTRPAPAPDRRRPDRAIPRAARVAARDLARPAHQPARHGDHPRRHRQGHHHVAR